MRKVTYWVVGTVVAVLCVATVGLWWVLEEARKGAEIRRLRFTTGSVMMGMAHANDAESEREFCRWIYPHGAIDWDDVCATPLVETRLWLPSSSDYRGPDRFNPSCGTDTAVRTFHQSREVELLVLYEYDDFTDLASRGFAAALQGLNERVGEWEAAVGEPRSFDDDTSPVFPASLREFSRLFSVSEATFHQCGQANFVRIDGRFYDR